MGKRKLGIIIAAGVATFIGLVTFFSSITTVPSGFTGVEIYLGKVTGNTYTDGLHFKAPFVTRIVKMDNQVQKEDVLCNAVSMDLQTVTSSIAVNYHLSTDSSASMYKTVGIGFVDKILLPAVQESTKGAMAQYKAEGLITQRAIVASEINELIQSKVQPYGILIDSLNITNFEFSKEFDAAIEAKQVAEQNMLRAETEKSQKIIEAEAAASEKTIAAQAEADSAMIKAQGEAEAIKLKADAEAEANKKIAASLTQSVLDNKSIEKWDGKYPTVMSGDSSSLLLDITKNTN